MAEFSHICCQPTGKKISERFSVDISENEPPSNSAACKPPAVEFDFKLDGFQREAIKCLEKRESVLVAAHTSAGKTAVAQYAMAMAMRDNQRVIYTTPIKALSNQKFRDLGIAFAGKFSKQKNECQDVGGEASSAGDVGLMTGDVTVNQEASCLVMTTEILRSMLYHGSDSLREVSWVVFDEVHYLRDKERGVVWEESIILLPPQIRLVFLSATIPNAAEFAQWIADLKGQPCHVISTDFRPTPLHHYMFPSGGRGLYLILDERNCFQEDTFLRMISHFDQDNKAKKGTKGPSDIEKVIRCVVEQGLQPAIVFSFSRRECEALALQLSRSKRIVGLISEAEEESVRAVFDNAIAGLAPVDQDLPQMQLMLPLLLKGIGVHHSGLLPILREVVEILFQTKNLARAKKLAGSGMGQEGLVKLLFATETFALGLNMPAKTCIFTNCRKFDGQEQRWLTSGEYIQMAGRAGRRGIDDRGVVISMLDTRLDPQAARDIVCGQACSLSSRFHLSYTMLLNAMRTSAADPETIIARSFYQFQHNAGVPTMLDKIRRLQAEAEAIEADAEGVEYLELARLWDNLQAAAGQALAADPRIVLALLSPGRLVRVAEGGRDWGWGVCLGFQRRTRPAQRDLAPLPGPSSADSFVADVLLPAAPTPPPGGSGGTTLAAEGNSVEALRPRPARGWRGWAVEGKLPAEGWRPVVCPVLLSSLRGVSAVRVAVSDDLRSQSSQERVLSTAYRALGTFEGGVPPLIPPTPVRNPTHVGAVPMGDNSADPVEAMTAWARMEAAGARVRGSRWRAAHLRLMAADRDPIAETNADQPTAAVSAPPPPLPAGPDAPPDSLHRTLEGGTVGEDAAAETLARCGRRVLLEREAAELGRRVRNSRVDAFRAELRSRMRVLRRLGYCTEDQAVTLKGRVACEVELCEDLAVVEMMLEGAFAGASAEDIASVMSCEVTEEKDDSGSSQEIRLMGMVRAMRAARARVADAESDAGLPVALAAAAAAPDLSLAGCSGNGGLGEPAHASREVNTSMMDLVHLWCSGADFAQLCARTKLFEGSIIRVMRREAELLRQLVLAAGVMGDTDLEARLVDALKKLQRGLPFSSSLYI